MSDLTQRDPRTYAIMRARDRSTPSAWLWLLESVYQETMAFELENRKIPHSRELKFPVMYKGRQLSCQYRPGVVIVELKVLSQLSPVEESQLINYLKVTGYHTGLLLNFGRKSLQQRRFVLT
jgi:GxxExxY protein